MDNKNYFSDWVYIILVNEIGIFLVPEYVQLICISNSKKMSTF